MIITLIVILVIDRHRRRSVLLKLRHRSSTPDRGLADAHRRVRQAIARTPGRGRLREEDILLAARETQGLERMEQIRFAILENARSRSFPIAATDAARVAHQQRLDAQAVHADAQGDEAQHQVAGGMRERRRQPWFSA